MKEKIKQIGKKKIILVSVFFIVIIIIIFGGAFIYNRYFYKRSFSEVENIMLSAAKSYMKKNPDNLPKNINDTINLSVSDLVRTEDMKDINEYIKDESISCSGNVIITNVNNNYRYTPDLDCGNKYKTSKFIDYIKSTQPIVESHDGLYNMNDELVFRGEIVNNFLKLNDKLYRIVKFVNDGAVIIYSEKAESVVWDNRYNLQKNSTVGINDYSVSKVKERLDELYRGNTLLNSDNKTLVIAHNLNIGKRNNNDTDKTGQLEKGAIMENQFIGLLPLNDYLNASLDQNCTTSISKSCQNYNYLAQYKYSWWTATGTSSNTYQVYKIIKSPNLTSASSNAYIRHVFYLTKDALYVSGNGSEKDPYIVK